MKAPAWIPADAGGGIPAGRRKADRAHGSKASNAVYLNMKPVCGLAQNVGLSDKDKGLAMNCA
jgi:hypothetical protein